MSNIGLIPLEEFVFTMVKDTQGRIHLLHGDPAVGAAAGGVVADARAAQARL